MTPGGWDRLSPDGLASSRSRRFRLWVLWFGVLMLVPFALLSYLLWAFHRPPAAYRRIAGLQVGMPRAEVIRVLGQPTSVSPSAKRLIYEGRLSWGILYVHFDDQWRYTRHVYDR